MLLYIISARPPARTTLSKLVWRYYARVADLLPEVLSQPSGIKGDQYAALGIAAAWARSIDTLGTQTTLGAGLRFLARYTDETAIYKDTH